MSARGKHEADGGAEGGGGGGGGGGSRGWKDRGALRGRCQCRRRWRSALSGGAPSDKSC